MTVENNSQARLAVLIDADNASYKDIRAVMDEVARCGTPTIKRAYGDWRRSDLSPWKDALLEIGAMEVQQTAYTKGKNATDAKMIIDAMDFLHTRRVDGFVLVSSDSDYTPLVMRLRESGMKVYGVGQGKTPMAFVKACDVFINVDFLRKPESAEKPEAAEASAKPLPKPSTIDFIAKSIADLADDSGYCNLAPLHALLRKKSPDFDYRKYGFSQFSKLLRALSRFELKEFGENKLLKVRDTQVK